MYRVYFECFGTFGWYNHKIKILIFFLIFKTHYLSLYIDYVLRQIFRLIKHVNFKFDVDKHKN